MKGVRCRILFAIFACIAAGTAGEWAFSHSDLEWDPRAPGTVQDARPLPPYRPPVFASGRPALAFLAVGDTGWSGPILDSVASRMERTASELPVSFVCLLGDNFYRSGIQSDADERWQTGFEQVFNGPHLAIPFRPALGNHDHKGNVQAQVEYSAKSTRWNMPGQYYSFLEPAGGNSQAQFFVLDTEALRRGDEASAEQLVWFENKLANSSARWKIVIGHHPVTSNGTHGPIPAIRDALVTMFEAHGVALYLSGHDHDLELLETGRGYLQVVSGAGSSTRSMRWGDDTLFASADPGFVWVGIEEDDLWLVFVDAARGPLYSRRFVLPKILRESGRMLVPTPDSRTNRN